MATVVQQTNGEKTIYTADEYTQVQQKFNDIYNTQLPSKANQTDMNTVNAQLAENTQSIGISISTFPRQSGETDDLPRFQRAVNQLQSQGGGRLVIPNTGTNYVFNATNPTVSNPYRVLVTSDNVEIIGIGKPIIEMNGIDLNYLNSISDYNSSGRDVFTAFSFTNVNNCKISGIHIIGTYTGTGNLNYSSPRAKGVAFIGCSDCIAEDISGVNILGNLINCVNAIQAYDGSSNLVYRIVITKCNANGCLEDGFDFMGGTYECVFSNNISENNTGDGLEAATQHLTVTGNVFKGNNVGFSFIGKDLVAIGNTSSNNVNGIVLTSSSGGGTIATDIILDNNVLDNNSGNAITIYPQVNNISITNNNLKDNATAGTANNNFGIYAVGSSTQIIKNLKVQGNFISDSVGNMQGAINLSYAEFINVSNNIITMYSTQSYSIYVQANTGFSNIYHNVVNKTISVSTGAYNNQVFNNPGDSSYRILAGSTAIPTSGTWIAGDKILNTNTTNSGDVIGWSCTKTGTFISSSAWVASTSYTVGTYVNANYKVYRCLVAGTSGTTSPSFSGGTGTDGTVTWEYISAYATPTFKVIGQLESLTSISSTPIFIGQMAVVGGIGYMATGVSSASDWKQITN